MGEPHSASTACATTSACDSHPLSAEREALLAQTLFALRHLATANLTKTPALFGET